MANYTKATLTRVGRLMSTGEANEPPALVKLAKSGAFGRKAIYNWSLPETDPQHRKMPRIAKRMIAMLAYFSAAGLLTDKRLEEIMALEATFENEKETNVLLRRMKRLIGGGKGAKAKTDALAAAGEEAGEEGDEPEDAEHAETESAEAEHATPKAA
jgi:hypothetical protein